MIHNLPIILAIWGFAFSLATIVMLASIPSHYDISALKATRLGRRSHIVIIVILAISSTVCFSLAAFFGG
jgi:hypothetical protein